MKKEDKKKIRIDRDSNGLINVARKEFSDHLQSKKFLIIFVLFLLISMHSLYVGIERYQEDLARYKEDMAAIRENVFPPGWMPERPSVLFAFVWMSMAMPFLGAVLAIAMGFDVVTKEKQQRTLKTLMSHPVYRDEIINGKAIGGIAAIGVAIWITFAISLAMLLIFGIVPTHSEFMSIILWGIVSLILLISYFAIALMTSTLSKDSGLSIISVFVIVLIIALILPVVGTFVAGHILGPPPEMPEGRWGLLPTPLLETAKIETEPITFPPPEPIPFEDDEEWRQWEEANRVYWERRMAIEEMFRMLDPSYHFGKITGVLGIGWGPVVPLDQNIDLMDKLERIWMNILGLIVIPTIFFAIAYTKFMKMDIR